MPQAAAEVKQAKQVIVGRQLESETYVYTIPEGLLPQGCEKVAVFAGDNLKKRLPKSRFKRSHGLCDALFSATNQIDYIRIAQKTQKRTVVEVQLKAGLKASDAVRDKIHATLEKFCGFTVDFKV